MQQTGLNPSCPDNTRILLQKKKKSTFYLQGYPTQQGTQ